MKIRNGFVSNSSSSSFIVISPYGRTEDLIVNPSRNSNHLVVDGKLGELEFGWLNKRYNRFWDKLHFSYFQALYVINTKWLNMLENVLKDYFDVDKIYWNIALNCKDGDKKEGYIDHQSCSDEGQNTEMFESEDTLKNFLFKKDSYIQCGNDNDY